MAHSAQNVGHQFDVLGVVGSAAAAWASRFTICRCPMVLCKVSWGPSTSPCWRRLVIMRSQYRRAGSEVIGHGLLSRFHAGCRCEWCTTQACEQGCGCQPCTQSRSVDPYFHIGLRTATRRVYR